MELHTLASGSSGNCILISHGGAHILIDAGISCRRILNALKELDICPQSVAGIFITHEHSDHISGLATLVKRLDAAVYAAPATTLELRRRISFPAGRLRELPPDTAAEVGGFAVTGFPISHDAAQPMGYSVCREGRRVAVATDLGYISPAVQRGVLGAQVVVCETNHDVALLRQGSYPYYLQERILSEYGHLSNEAGAELARQCVEQGAHTLILAHLSEENNTPALALGAVKRVLNGAAVTVEVAPRSEPSRSFEV